MSFYVLCLEKDLKSMESATQYIIRSTILTFETVNLLMVLINQPLCSQVSLSCHKPNNSCTQILITSVESNAVVLYIIVDHEGRSAHGIRTSSYASWVKHCLSLAALPGGSSLTDQEDSCREQGASRLITG